MAVALDTTSVASPFDRTNYTWDHTPVGTPRGVIVLIEEQGSGGYADYVDSVTYGGVTMTEASVGSSHLNGAEDMSAYAFFLGSSVASGTQTVSVTFSGAGTPLFNMQVITLTANDDIELVTDSKTWISADQYITLSVSGRTCFSAFSWASGRNDYQTSPIAGCVDIQEITASAGCQGGTYRTTVDATDPTVGRNNGGISDEWAGVALAVSEVLPTAIPLWRRDYAPDNWQLFHNPR